MSGVLAQFSSPLGHVRGSGLHPHLQELKEEMRKLDLDWANYLRTTIEEKFGAERMTRACTTMDQLIGVTSCLKIL